jgi:DNA primase small subunit
MRRHKAFGSQKELYSYLGAVSPAHVYYSTACYAHPSATRMQEKKWEGADIIFDLDADKLLADSAPQYALMLIAVKNETAKLLDFLMNDFSFDHTDFSIVFSGGRGYHVHLRAERLATLGSHERREVVNYLTGTGLAPEYLLKRTNMMPTSDDNSCWEIRIRSWIDRYFKRLSELDAETAIIELTSVKAIGKRRAKEIVDEMSQDSTIQPLLQSKLMPLAAWKSLIREAISQIKVTIDVPVTADTKRLIRLPTSLHGGSGLRVTPLTLDEFRLFDPLHDAVVFSDRFISVRILKPTTAELKGETIKVQQGTTELPEHTAVYLMARGLAEYESRRFKSDQK